MSFLLFKMTLRQLLKNPYGWGWGFFFITFWLVMGAYVFSLQIPANLPGDAYVAYTGSWFSIATVLSATSIAVSLVLAKYQSSFSLRYLTKYTKLTTLRYYLIDVISYLIYFMIFVGLFLGELIAMYSQKFSLLVVPKEPVPLLLATSLSVVFVYVLAGSISYGVLALNGDF